MDSTQDSGSWDLGSTPRWRIIVSTGCLNSQCFFVFKTQVFVNVWEALGQPKLD